MQDKTSIAEKSQKLIELTAGFCDRHADEEYKQLCAKMIQKMARKRNVPFLSGRIEIWGAAIVYAIGSMNFLFDRSFKPYATANDIANYFGASKSTVVQKAKTIRDMFKLGYFNEEFSTARMRESNPFSNLVMVNGFLLDKRTLPPEIQEML